MAFGGLMAGSAGAMAGADAAGGGDLTQQFLALLGGGGGGGGGQGFAMSDNQTAMSSIGKGLLGFAQGQEDARLARQQATRPLPNRTGTAGFQPVQNPGLLGLQNLLLSAARSSPRIGGF